ncbi:hypothetical protein [Sinorhizobium fredii]|nr:hypothetical protein [Sinorhizobium fredii]AWI61247.1 hypothetical protein AB395_00006070 [Sinorhizobium fredii CCBAU 45436]
MGFEALLRGNPVTCYGLPFYAESVKRMIGRDASGQTRSLKVPEIFAASLRSGGFTAVIQWLNELQRKRQEVAWPRSQAEGRG